MDNQKVKPGSFSEQAKVAAGNIKEKASSMATTTADAAKDRGSEFLDAAKETVSHATDKLSDVVDEKKHAGAEYIGRVAETIRRAGREVEKEMPFVGPYVQQAANQIDGVGKSIRSGDINDLVSGVQDFARRQPVAFLGIATLAGFAAVRFVKSAPPSVVGSSSVRTSHAAAKGYRDEFTK
jgi:hypothetical protein